MSQRVTITLPEEAYVKIKEQAERDYRTIGAEIAYLLHLHVPAYKTLATEPFGKQPTQPTQTTE